MDQQRPRKRRNSYSEGVTSSSGFKMGTPRRRASKRRKSGHTMLTAKFDVSNQPQPRVMNTPNRKTHEISKAMSEMFKAAGSADMDAVRALIKRDPDLVDAESQAGWRPLHFAAYHGHGNILYELIQHDANVDAQNLEGNTPLHDAAYRGHLGIVEALIKANADVNVVNNDQRTPLHTAAIRGRSEVASMLMGGGARTHLPDKDGQTALQNARRWNRPSVSKIIEEYDLSHPPPPPVPMEIDTTGQEGADSQASSSSNVSSVGSRSNEDSDSLMQNPNSSEQTSSADLLSSETRQVHFALEVEDFPPPSPYESPTTDPSEQLLETARRDDIMDLTEPSSSSMDSTSTEPEAPQSQSSNMSNVYESTQNHHVHTDDLSAERIGNNEQIISGVASSDGFQSNSHGGQGYSIPSEIQQPEASIPENFSREPDVHSPEQNPTPPVYQYEQSTPEGSPFEYPTESSLESAQSHGHGLPESAQSHGLSLPELAQSHGHGLPESTQSHGLGLPESTENPGHYLPESAENPQLPDIMYSQDGPLQSDSDRMPSPPAGPSELDCLGVNLNSSNDDQRSSSSESVSSDSSDFSESDFSDAEAELGGSEDKVLEASGVASKIRRCCNMFADFLAVVCLIVFSLLILQMSSRSELLEPGSEVM
eukprot:482129_1